MHRVATRLCASLGLAALTTLLAGSAHRTRIARPPTLLPARAARARQRDPRRLNLILIVIDSLRGDRLSSTGYHLPTSPCMDQLARDGFLFDRFFTATAPTVPACTSLFSGQHPLTHRVLLRKGGGDLDQEAPWFPEVLREQGYATGAVDNLTDRKPWFARGFQEYLNLRSRGDEYHTCFHINRAALRWIDRHRDDRFFLYLRYGDTHTPYRPPRPFAGMFGGPPSISARRDLRELWHSPWRSYLLTQGTLGDLPSPTADGHVDVDWCRAQYDAGVRTADAGLAELLAALERMGLTEETIVVVLGDHGESLGEHGIFFDHYGLYEEVLRPPLIIRWPGHEGRRIGALTQMPDLCPTVLEMLGIPVPAGVEGHSLVPLLTGRAETVGHSRLLACECNWGFRWAMRTERWKLIVSRAPDLLHPRPAVELYDLASDPEESCNLAELDPALAVEPQAEFEALLNRRLDQRGDPVRREATLGHPQLRWRLLKTRIRWDLWLRIHLARAL